MTYNKHGFTLIELVFVIAIIGILFSFSMSAVQHTKNSALSAKTKIQLEKYAHAVNLYYIEYGVLPSFIDPEKEFNLNSGNNASLFVKTMSCHDVNGFKLTNEDQNLNQNNIVFCEFTDDDFFINQDKTINKNVIADSFNNKEIIIIVKNKYSSNLTIPQSCFTSRVQHLVPVSGLSKQVAIYSINNNKIICNWETK